MNPGVQLSIVVAVQRSEANLPAIREALDTAANPDVEFIFCHAATAADACRQADGGVNVADLYGGNDALIPHLWRDGIRAATGAWVATTTAHCIPTPDWVARLRESAASGDAAVGGLLRNDADARPMDWSIFLLRYAAYASPQPARSVADVAADNAVYRRALVIQHRDLLADGFWEPSFHAALRAGGHALRLEPSLLVVHRNRYRAVDFFRQRVAHGRQFGRARARALRPWARIGLLVAAPVLPLLFLRKIVIAASRHPVCAPRLLTASGWLVVFLCGWGLGEAQGYFDAVRGTGAT
jgi:hypothetical protein